MKKLPSAPHRSHNKKVVCAVSAAALMLGVSSAATVGLHFQVNYCSQASYTGFPVTMTAFGIATNGWENLTEMDTGYNCAPDLPGYTLSEVVDTDSTTNGLNPLPNGSLTVSWFGPTANFSGFAGYAGYPPSYDYDGTYPGPNIQPTGEQEIYSSFLRDGYNFGPGSTGGTNTQPGYQVGVTGLKSLFTNGPFVVELIAASDSMQALTNAWVVDVLNSLTNSVTYPRTPPITEDEGFEPWVRGHGGGLSTSTGALSTDHIVIMSNHPMGGGNKTDGFDNAGTISGFILTDKPLVTMSPRSIAVAGPDDSIVLSAYAIGVPPLSLQWRLNGKNIPKATNLSFSIPSVNLSSGGNYELVVTNVYGATTSQVASVTVDRLTQSIATNVVYDSNPSNPQHNGIDLGAAWEASSTGGAVTRTGVMNFAAAQTNGILVEDSTNFNGPTGTITFWMQSAGTVDPTGNGAALFFRPTGTNLNNFALLQADTGNLYFYSPNNGGVSFTSTGTVSDNKWHFVALTFDQTASGGAGLFLDGALDTTNSNALNWSWTTGEPLEIGYSSDTNFASYNGVLDDIRYYSAVLTTNQIAAIYNSGALEDTADLQMQLNFTAPPEEGITLMWLEGSAVLQSAASVAGPWMDVDGATSPCIIIPSAAQQFFRYRYIPQTLQSNPYLM
jgi:hypothetical protein